MLRIKDFLTLALIVLILSSCGVSQQDKEEIATITCNIIKSSRNMDAALRIKEINLAREQIGEERFLGTDVELREAIELSLCELLVMNDASYQTVRNAKLIAEIERQKAAEEEERLERERIAAEQREKHRLESKRIFDERKYISNLYGDYEQLENNHPVDFTLKLNSFDDYGAWLVDDDGQYYFFEKNDEIKEWNVKIVYTSSDTKSIVLQDIRNNNFFLISLN